MAKKKTKNNKKLVSFWCDPNEWEELPNNINCSKSEFLRQAVSNQIKKSDKNKSRPFFIGILTQ